MMLLLLLMMMMMDDDYYYYYFFFPLMYRHAQNMLKIWTVNRINVSVLDAFSTANQR